MNLDEMLEFIEERFREFEFPIKRLRKRELIMIGYIMGIWDYIHIYSKKDSA